MILALLSWAMDSKVSHKVQDCPKWYECEDLMTGWVVPSSGAGKLTLQLLLLIFPMVESWRSLPLKANNLPHCSHFSKETSTLLHEKQETYRSVPELLPCNNTQTFLLRHSLDWDFSIDVWPDLSVSNTTANKSSAHWADPIWPDRDKMTRAGWKFSPNRKRQGKIEGDKAWLVFSTEVVSISFLFISFMSLNTISFFFPLSNENHFFFCLWMVYIYIYIFWGFFFDRVGERSWRNCFV